jgi:hypothetical protein
MGISGSSKRRGSLDGGRISARREAMGDQEAMDEGEEGEQRKKIRGRDRKGGEDDGRGAEQEP